MKDEKPCLSRDLDAILTILIAAALLLCVSSNNLVLALPLIVGMVLLKKRAIRCYDRKSDKFYYYAYILAGSLLSILLLSQ
jgi:hypothetical protein